MYAIEFLHIRISYNIQIYERRSKFGREANIWEAVTVDMMSDEEKREDTYVRHIAPKNSIPFLANLMKGLPKSKPVTLDIKDPLERLPKRKLLLA